MSTATFVGNADSSGSTGFCPAPPPPPPPPVPGQMPAMRINTVETPMSRRSMVKNNDPYEPPAAIQNAMMTKDKKPFTYTPGMGGKLDLSQIRSPRMARRVAKNANDEGIEGPPKSPLAAEQSRPVPTGVNLFVQPQVAVPVFPTNIPPAPQPVRPPQQINRARSNANDQNIEPMRPTVRIEQKIPSQPTTPDTPTTPPQITLAKAPTPWLQNKNKPQEELPEWAKRSPTNGSSSTYSPPESPASSVQTIYIQQPPSPPSIQPSLSRPAQPKVVQQVKPVQSTNERIIPLQVEDRPSVFSVKIEPGHHQLKQSSPHHQQRWGQPASSPQSQSPSVNRVISNPPKTLQSSSPGTYIVPIVVEGSNDKTTTVINNSYQQPGPAQNQVNRNVQKTPITTQQESGPVQSRSFRVLQKITDTDGDEVDNEQLRKLRLTEDDKVLMNKFKEQVDGDNYLHQEEDPRYRGAAIPSRAFRYLQNMTDSSEVPANPNAAPRAVNSALKRQNRNSRTFEETQANLPPSEQQVQEPKKYTGSAIPSRSFKILQAMTTPEAVAKQENRQADITYQVESSMMPQGNQHGVFIPQFPHQQIYWAYCPIPYPPCISNQPNHFYPFPLNNVNINTTNINNSLVQFNDQDANASINTNYFMPYTLYPLYNQHFPPPIGDNKAQQQLLWQQQGTYCNDSLVQPIWNGTINETKSTWDNANALEEIKSNEDGTNFSKSNYQNGQGSGISSNFACHNDGHEFANTSSHSSHDNEHENENNFDKIDTTSMKNSEVSSMNIIQEEITNQSMKRIDNDDTDKSTNDDNIGTDSDESSSDKTSVSSNVINALNNNGKDNTNDDEDNSSNSESDSDSYLAYSTGLNPRVIDNDSPVLSTDKTEDKQNTDCESYMEEDDEGEKEKKIAVEKKVGRSETPSEMDSTGWKVIPEEDDEPSDNVTIVGDGETINVRLPFRFRRSVALDEKVTTPIENSDVKSADHGDDINNSRVINDGNNDICVSLKIPKETSPSVDFTLKRNFTTMRPKSWCPDVAVQEFWACKTIVNNCQHTIIPVDSDSHEDEIDEKLIADDTRENEKESIDESNTEMNVTQEIPQFEVTMDDSGKNTIDNDDEDTFTDDCNKNQHLLTVQNSRDETDDDDSGVTSDMSRIISEVDTDSECGPTARKINAYTRTQTHSRLFKLLNDDLASTNETRNSLSKSIRKNQLNLPLKQSNEFNYDCSNASSGVTSPDYSPVQDSTDCKRLQELEKSFGDTNEDRFSKTWKKLQESSTNTITQVNEPKTLSHWSYKSNVLCPRIKSSKSVPKALQSRMKKQSSIHPIQSCVEYDRC